MFIKIESIDTIDNILFIDENIIRFPYIFKLVKAYLREQR